MRSWRRRGRFVQPRLLARRRKLRATKVGRWRRRETPKSFPMRRAFVIAHAAVDAQVGNFANLIGREEPGVGPFLEQMTQQIGLGARCRGLGVGGAEQRTHALLGRFRAAMAATVAIRALVS